MNKQEQINRLQFRIERIENELGLVQPDYFAMPIKSNLSEKPNSYDHLLPDGYEFCKKEECDEETEIMYLKVKLHNLDPNEKPLGSIMQDVKHMEAFYTPIRQKVQYHVAVHEAVTTEPNPYAVDWSNAPEWAEFHMYDETKSGYFKGWVTRGCFWNGCFAPSGFTLPTGLDWKLSKTTRP
jgi:hypothetical protein